MSVKRVEVIISLLNSYPCDIKIYFTSFQYPLFNELFIESQRSDNYRHELKCPATAPVLTQSYRTTQKDTFRCKGRNYCETMSKETQESGEYLSSIFLFLLSFLLSFILLFCLVACLYVYVLFYFSFSLLFVCVSFLLLFVFLFCFFVFSLSDRNIGILNIFLKINTRFHLYILSYISFLSRFKKLRAAFILKFILHQNLH